jgi:hypothetical protein
MIPKEILEQIPAEPTAQRLWYEENFKEITIPAKLGLAGVCPNDKLRTPTATKLRSPLSSQPLPNRPLAIVAHPCEYGWPYYEDDH